MKFFASLVVAVSLISVSCTKKSDDGAPSNPIIADQFKDMEFEGEKPLFVAMLKLRIPPLLTTVRKSNDGTPIVDDNHVEVLEAEQADMIEELKKISPEIKVLFTYKMVLNALAVEAPQDLADQISALNVEFIEGDERFAAPIDLLSEVNGESDSRLATLNSMTFIGAEKVHQELGVKGKGMKIGVIDSGIDYTHSMLGGDGSVETFKSIDANGVSSHFPNSKVVGGRDFVGASFNTSSHIYSYHIPKPDENPLDRSGHGSHVAGTVAGIGDGTNTYSGAAPEASLYALKVFSDEGGGSTADTVVIAALEYAADPNADGDLSDQLDVVNLSLGGGYGKPHSLYNQAIGNLVDAGTVVVAAAGNAGPRPNIVGAPSTADAAISVAASVDNMDHNWKFRAVAFQTTNNPKLLVEAVEGAITKSIVEAGNIQGKLVYIGNATSDLSAEQLAELEGHVALIDRGGVSFVDKIKRAQGAIGIVMANDREGEPITMGGDESFDIPGIMVTQAMGNILKQEMQQGDVSIQFLVQDKVEKPELIDTLADFSSRGPRSLDGLIKPEISAPGVSIISARVGSGAAGVAFGGTSMASPHMAGVMALLKQYRSDLTAHELKALVMSTSLIVDDEKANIYPISRQGAGRVQAYKAATAPLLLDQHSISLGEIQVESGKVLHKKVSIKNISQQPVEFSFSSFAQGAMTLSAVAEKTQLEPGEETEVAVDIRINPVANLSAELDAFLQIKVGEDVVAQLPIMAVVSQMTRMQVEALAIKAGSLDEANGAAVDLTLRNNGSSDGEALVFNLLGRDQRKKPSLDPFLSLACDMESSGYRVIERGDKSVLQVGIKIFNPVNSWGNCFVSVEIDNNNDQVADQEIYGYSISSLPGLRALGISGYGSMLFDSEKLRKISEDYQLELAKQQADAPSLDYLPALQAISSMGNYEHSTIAVVEADVSALTINNDGELKLRVSVSYNGGSVVEGDDFLSDSNDLWKTINLNEPGAGYHGIPESLVVPAGGTTTVELTKGDKKEEGLLVYYPRNRFILALSGSDGQSETPEPVFQLSEIVNP